MQVLEERRATGDSPVAGAEALIEEARQRTRRRRLYTTFAFVVIVLGALIGSIATRGNGHAPRIPRPYPQVQTTGVAQILDLSAGDPYESLTVSEQAGSFSPAVQGDPFFRRRVTPIKLPRN